MSVCSRAAKFRNEFDTLIAHEVKIIRSVRMVARRTIATVRVDTMHPDNVAIERKSKAKPSSANDKTFRRDSRHAQAVLQTVRLDFIPHKT